MEKFIPSHKDKKSDIKNKEDNARVKFLKELIDLYQITLDEALNNNLDNFSFTNVSDAHREISAELENRVYEELKKIESTKEGSIIDKYNIFKYEDYWNEIIKSEMVKGLNLDQIYSKYLSIVEKYAGNFGVKYLIPTEARFKNWEKNTGIPQSNVDLADLILLRKSDEDSETLIPKNISIDVKSKQIGKWKSSNAISISRFLEWSEQYIKWFKNEVDFPPPPLIYIEVRHRKVKSSHISEKITVRDIRQLIISESGSTHDGYLYPNPAQNQIQFSAGEHPNNDLTETPKFISKLAKRVIPIFENKKKKMDKDILRWKSLIIN